MLTVLNRMPPAKRGPRFNLQDVMPSKTEKLGSVNGIRAKSELGLSGDVVMKLASTLPEGQNYKIYADNYFTCVQGRPLA
ncbi:hypothetical protein NQZ68_014286 [Dissostichus eleginoides]|nr:hypothetical protein NQZ68_014286 [Dissostichus eleginoides]